MIVSLQLSLEGSFDVIPELFIFLTFFISVLNPYFNSEAFECVPAGFLHKSDAGDVVLDPWNIASDDAEDEHLPSALEDCRLSDAGDLHLELTAIFVLLVLPLWVNASLEHHQRSDLVLGIVILGEPKLY